MQILPFLCLDGNLRPITPEGEAVLLEQEGKVVKAEILTPKRLHTRQQEKYWWAVLVPMILQCWLSEKAWSIKPTKEAVHDAIVRALYGEIETPFGMARARSSSSLTIEQYSELIEAGKEHLLTKYKVIAPEPGQSWEEL